MPVRSIIGVYDYVDDKVMTAPKAPTSQPALVGRNFDAWVAAYESTFGAALNELKTKIKHVSYAAFQNSLKTAITKFKTASSGVKKFHCVALVQPGKSQKWVTEVAMQKGFKANAYVCLGEEGADNLEYSLRSISPKDKRFKNIVIIDDGSFSGNQMANNISAAHRILKKKFNDEAPQFHVLIPYITKTAKDKIEKLSEKGVKVTLYSAEQMPTVTESVSKSKLSKLLEALWPHLGEEERLARGNSSSLYWFAHKMPNSMSFPDVVATGKVTQPKNEEDADPIAFLPEVVPPYK